MIAIREYVPDDRSACLAIFDSNTPQFFATCERTEFASFLDEIPGRYFVSEDDGTVIACGGFAVGSDRAVAVLCWGMVHRNRHMQGAGKLLLTYRLSEIRRDPMIRRVTINTSQHTSVFFEKFGFTVERVIRGGYALGLDRYEMNLIVTPDSQKSNSGAIITA